MPSRYRFIDPAGAEHVLDDYITTFVLDGVAGRGMPPIGFTTQELPGQPGATLRQTKAQVRDIDIPLYVKALSSTDLAQRLRDWADRLNPMRGDGTLRCTWEDDVQREIACRYANGYELNESEANRGRSWQRVVLVFRAFDPFWSDVADTNLSFAVGAPTATFFPFFPLRLNTSEVVATSTVTNDGHEEAWPVWTITGPGSVPTIRNMTTGEAIQLNYTIPSGGQVIIDTRPKKKTVRDAAGNNLYGNMTDASVLWSLRRGANSVRVEMTGATVASLISLAYRRRWLA